MIGYPDLKNSLCPAKPREVERQVSVVSQSHFLQCRPRPLKTSEGEVDAQKNPVTRAVVKLRQVAQANQKGEGESDRVTTRLLPRRGSNESGLQRYEEQPCGWRVSHSPALPNLERKGQENPGVTPEGHSERMKGGSPGSAL